MQAQIEQQTRDFDMARQEAKKSSEEVAELRGRVAVKPQKPQKGGSQSSFVLDL